MGKQSSVSEYKNKWGLDLVTQENQWQNMDFRNNAIIFASLDLKFCLGPLLLFDPSFSCHVKRLVLYSMFQAAKHSSEGLTPLSCRCSEFKALLGLVTWDSWGTLPTQCPVSLCGADLLLACSWPEGRAGRRAGWLAECGHFCRQSLSALHGWDTASLEKGTGRCLQSACPAPEHLVWRVSLLAMVKDGVLSWVYFGSDLLCLFLPRAHKKEGVNNIIPHKLGKNKISTGSGA